MHQKFPFSHIPGSMVKTLYIKIKTNARGVKKRQKKVKKGPKGGGL